MSATLESNTEITASEKVRLAFGLWSRAATTSAADQPPSLRDLTLSWLRFGYQGEVLMAESLTTLLRRACAAGYTACFVQRPGHIITEDWSLPHWRHDDVYQLLRRTSAAEDFLIAVQPGPDRIRNPLESAGILVQLDRYRALGQPALDDWPSNDPVTLAIDEAEIIELPSTIMNKMTQIESQDQSLPPDDQSTSPVKCRFLRGVETQLKRGREGVFLWNIEFYDDVPNRPPHGSGSLKHLYCVAAGFKPNFLLHRYGFQRNAQVTFFDYSQQALEIRRYLIEHWNGSDYPEFCRVLMQRFADHQTFYQLWNGIKPEQIDWRDATALWQFELARWGGADAFKRAWQHQRKLQYKYVHCDVVSDPAPLLTSIEVSGPAAIWWSNAFFTISSNWTLSIKQRQQRFLRWIEALREQAPDCLLYGADYLNSAINNLSARVYLERLQASAAANDQAELKPVQNSSRALRF